MDVGELLSKNIIKVGTNWAMVVANLSKKMQFFLQYPSLNNRET
jgi:hypothetical protein